MGVFARLLRRSKATEAPAAETGAGSAKAGAGAESAKAGAGTESADAGAGTEEAAAAAEVKAAEGTAEAAEPAAKDTETEGVDIPKQQSTDKAADNEAGDGART
ncbi:hypothetical protein [Streptomyces sp. bgisy032]|uniref:hypothetical protein n=1 Tax=Streptomyces sp. bgisy032 TaxID=3413773 RepID=UPI003D71AAE7